MGSFHVRRHRNTIPFLTHIVGVASASITASAHCHSRSLCPCLFLVCVTVTVWPILVCFVLFDVVVYFPRQRLSLVKVSVGELVLSLPQLHCFSPAWSLFVVNTTKSFCIHTSSLCSSRIFLPAYTP